MRGWVEGALAEQIVGVALLLLGSLQEQSCEMPLFFGRASDKLRVSTQGVEICCCFSRLLLLLSANKGDLELTEWLSGYVVYLTSRSRLSSAPSYNQFFFNTNNVPIAAHFLLYSRYVSSL